MINLQGKEMNVFMGKKKLNKINYNKFVIDDVFKMMKNLKGDNKGEKKKKDKSSKKLSKRDEIFKKIESSKNKEIPKEVLEEVVDVIADTITEENEEALKTLEQSSVEKDDEIVVSEKSEE